MASIYCSNCGQLISANSNFCRFCGAAQHGAEAAVYRVGDPVTKKQIGTSAILRAQTSEPKPPKTEPETTKHVTKKHLAPLVVVSFMIGYLKTTSILLLMFLIGLLIDPLLFGGAFLAYLIIIYLIAGLAYNSFTYTIDDDGFQKEHGIINKDRTSIPYSRVQNVNITRSISDRLLGLARIDIETAGTSSTKLKNVIGGSYSSAEGHLPGLTLKQAKKLHDLLLHNASMYKKEI